MAENTVKARQDSFNSSLKRQEHEVSKVERHITDEKKYYGINDDEVIQLTWSYSRAALR